MSQLAQLNDWIVPAVVMGILVFAQLRFRRPKTPLVEIKRLVSEEGAALIDVRSPGEFGGGAIPGARNIPLDRLRTNLGGLNPEKPVVVYCQSGARSAFAAKLLRDARFRAVHDLGAIANWR